MNETRPNLLSSILKMAACSAMVVLFSADAALGQNGFNIRLGESTRSLEAELLHSRDPNDLTAAELAEIMMEESCVNPVTRYHNRNRFAIMIENTSTTNDLDSVTIDLTETDFEWGNGDIASDGFAGLLTMFSDRSDAGVSVSASHGNDLSEIVLDFEGLSPGTAAIFRLDLDPSATNTSGLLYPDFREALLGANGRSPALFDISYSDGVGFSDLEFEGEFTTTINPAALEAYHAQSMAFNFGGSQVIPEPSTMTMLLIGVASLGRRYRAR